MRRARKTPLPGNASLSEWRFPLSECHCLACWAPLPRLAGVTRERCLLFGANTPWKRVRFTRGLGTRAASRAMKSSGSKMTCVVPSRYGVFNWYRTLPFGVSDRRFSAIAGRLMYRHSRSSFWR